MIVLALFTVFGLVAEILLYFFFGARGAAQRAMVRADMDEQMNLKLRKAQDSDEALVTHLLAGAAVDQALGDYQRQRAAILVVDKPDRPWDWNGDDLKLWGKRELQRRLEEVNRQVLLPALGTSLGTMTLTIVACVVYYQFMAAQSITSNGTVPPATNGANSNLPGFLPPVAVPAAQAQPPDDPGNPVDPDMMAPRNGKSIAGTNGSATQPAAAAPSTAADNPLANGGPPAEAAAPSSTTKEKRP